MAQAGQEVAQPWGSLLGQHQAGAEGFVGSAITLGQSPGSALGLIHPSLGGCGCSCLSAGGFLERAGRDGLAVLHTLCWGAGTVQALPGPMCCCLRDIFIPTAAFLQGGCRKKGKAQLLGQQC